uniref:Uncharacterized protein n=1 Tax=Rhizophora mucronata TaxID=61149 RepID=A0A2P2R379_RHIMU
MFRLLTTGMSLWRQKFLTVVFLYFSPSKTSYC